LASFDGEEKLGQPMVHFSLIKDWGVLDLFALVGFRERDFAGESGRLRPLIPIAAEASYQSDQEWQHIDFAARWSNSIDDWEVGVSVFSGTSREPEFRPQYNIDTQQFELQAYYGLINQLGIDVQYIYEDWLWKLEAISRHSNTMQDQNALVGGFEYSVIGIADTAIDLGLVLEYGYDDREQGAPIQNDLSFATRWAFNDAESSEILIGINTDLDYSGSQSAFIEGSTRIGESTVVTLDAWFFRADEPDDISYGFRRDDFIQLDVSYYF
jgi:hypothetical protein